MIEEHVKELSAVAELAQLKASVMLNHALEDAVDVGVSGRRVAPHRLQRHGGRRAAELHYIEAEVTDWH